MMPVATLCPSCQTRYNLPDAMQGKQVRCKKCNNLFTVAPAPAPRPSKIPAPAKAPAKPAPATADDAPLPRKSSGFGIVVALLMVVGLLGAGGGWFFGWGPGKDLIGKSDKSEQVAKGDTAAEMLNDLTKEMSKQLPADVPVPKVEDGKLVVPIPDKGQPAITLPDVSKVVDPGKLAPDKAPEPAKLIDPSKIDPATVVNQVKPAEPPPLPDVLKPDPNVTVEPRLVCKDDKSISTFALSADGELLVAGLRKNSDGGMKVWELGGGTEKAAPPLKNPVVDIALSPDGKTVVAMLNDASGGGGGQEIGLFDLATGKLTRTIKRDQFVFLRLAYSPDGKTIAASTVKNVNENPAGGFKFREITTIRLYDPETGKQQKALEDVHRAGMRSMVFTADSKTLITAGNTQVVNGVASKGEVKAWDLDSGTARMVFQDLPGHISNAALSSDGKLLAAGYLIIPKGGDARLWDLASGKELLTFNTGGKGVSSVAFSPDNKLLAVGDSDRKVRLFDTATGKDYGGFKVNGYSGPRHLVFTPNGKSLLIQETNTVAVWDLAAARPLGGADDPLAKLKKPPQPNPVTKTDPPKPPDPMTKTEPAKPADPTTKTDSPQRGAGNKTVTLERYNQIVPTTTFLSIDKIMGRDPDMIIGQVKLAKGYGNSKMWKENNETIEAIFDPAGKLISKKTSLLAADPVAKMDPSKTDPAPKPDPVTKPEPPKPDPTAKTDPPKPDPATKTDPPKPADPTTKTDPPRPPVPTMPVKGTTEEVVRIVNRNSGKIFAPERKATADGTRVLQADFVNGDPNCLWKIVPADGEWITIKNINSGTLLSVAGESSANSADIVIWKPKDGPPAQSQQWKLVPVANAKDHVKIVNRATGKPFGVDANKTTNGARIAQWIDVPNTANQEWKLEKVESAATTPDPKPAPPDPKPASPDPKPATPRPAPANTEKGSLTRDNIAKIKLDMTEAEVTGLLGKPTVTENLGKGVRRLTWGPNSDKKYFLGVFRGGKLTNADHWWRNNDPQGLADLSGK